MKTLKVTKVYRLAMV